MYQIKKLFLSRYIFPRKKDFFSYIVGAFPYFSLFSGMAIFVRPLTFCSLSPTALTVPAFSDILFLKRFGLDVSIGLASMYPSSWMIAGGWDSGPLLSDIFLPALFYSNSYPPKHFLRLLPHFAKNNLM